MLQKNKNFLWAKRSYALVLMACLASCAGKKTGSGEEQVPAEITNEVKESTLTTIRLTQEAEQRLGIATKTVEVKEIENILKVGGEIMAPPGQEIKIIAPGSGTIVPAENGSFPIAGSRVSKGQELMRLVIIPPASDMISARQDVTVKQMEYDAVRAEAERAEKLLASEAISNKDYEAILAQLAKAEALLNAANGRLALYEGNDPDAAADNLSIFSIESPISGIIQRLNVSQEQTIAGASVILEVSPVNRFWVRVPVYSGDLSRIDRNKKAIVSTMGDESEAPIMYASPVQGPLLSDPNRASSDLYFEIDNMNGMLRSGQKVSVVLSLASKGSSLVVPYSSILYDLYGGNWVYIKTEPQLYTRTRIEISHVSDSLAVLTRGVSPGDEVVYKGSAELYGTEFGLGK